MVSPPVRTPLTFDAFLRKGVDQSDTAPRQMAA